MLVLLAQSLRSGRAEMSASRRVIDSHLHIWSDGMPPYPWAVEPPDNLKSAATVEELLRLARDAGVSGALIVQPANHKYDHTYLTAALRREPNFFRGMSSTAQFEPFHHLQLVL